MAVTELLQKPSGSMLRATQRPAPSDFLELADLGPELLSELLESAAAMKRSPHLWLGSLRGRSVAMLFEKPSTRTRVSFAVAVNRLGMLPIELEASALQISRGETLGDTARALAAYVDAIVIRSHSQERIAEIAAAVDIPVINALSAQHHPCQALADLLTVEEVAGRLPGTRVTFVGDGANNVAHSLIQAAGLTGVQLTVACPPGYEPAIPLNPCVEVMQDPREAVRDADVIYTDVWTSMTVPVSEQAQRQRDFAPYQVNAELLGRARPGAAFMHCLPAHRGQEVTAEVIDGCHSVVWQQAANRMPTEQALLHLLLH